MLWETERGWAQRHPYTVTAQLSPRRHVCAINYMIPQLFNLCYRVITSLLAFRDSSEWSHSYCAKSQLPELGSLNKECHGEKTEEKKPTPISLQGLSFLFFIAIYFPPGIQCQYIGRPSSRWRQWNLAQTLNTGSSLVCSSYVVVIW